MDKHRSNMKGWGWVLIFLAIYDVFMIIINNIVDFTSGELSKAFSALSGSPFEATIKGITIGILVFYGLVFIVQIYLGTKAFRICRLDYQDKGRAHIIIAKIMGVVNLILTILLVVNLFSAKFEMDKILTLLVSIADVFIMFSYAKDAKAIRTAILEGK